MSTAKEFPIYIGYDPRESIAYQLAKFSIERRTSYPVKVIPLKQMPLRESGVYWRPSFTSGMDGQFIDGIDGRPYSSEFTFTRFLVPAIAKAQGYTDWAMFVDCDFLYLDDIAELLLKRKEGDWDLMCVKHNFSGTMDKKLDNKAQHAYPRKLWSSMFLVNLKAQDYEITPQMVNTWQGRDLHAFKGCPDNLIGAVDEAWNFIPGHSEPRVDEPKAIHYSEKSPWFEGQENCKWGDLWWKEMDAYKNHIHITKKKEHFW